MSGASGAGSLIRIVMPNGKGSLECCYCVSWRGEYQGYDGAYEAGFCEHHGVLLPSTISDWGHRICTDFRPNEYFKRDSRISAEERFAWFGTHLKPKVLYVFSYNSPPDIRELATLNKQA